MMGAVITLMCGHEACEVQEPRGPARVSSLERTSLLHLTIAFCALTHACRNAPPSSGGVSVLPRIGFHLWRAMASSALVIAEES